MTSCIAEWAWLLAWAFIPLLALAILWFVSWLILRFT